MTDVADRSDARKQVRPLGRWLVAFLALAILVTGVVDYEIARAINGYYFQTHAVPLTMTDLVLGVLALYLFAVAITGRWWPARRVS